jgi:hypothetical protein
MIRCCGSAAAVRTNSEAGDGDDGDSLTLDGRSDGGLSLSDVPPPREDDDADEEEGSAVLASEEHENKRRTLSPKP